MSVGCDVAVVGAGPVGATLACALGGSGLRVVLLDAAPAPAAPADDAPFEPRVSAVSVASRRVLEAVGGWAHLSPARRAPFREMRVWDAPGSAGIHFDAADMEAGLPELGHIVENRALGAALATRVASLPGVRELRPAALDAIEFGDEEVWLRAGSERVRAALVVGADGARSAVREAAGIEVRGGWYDQEALVANVLVRDGHRDTAWQRFLPTGPLAILPLPGDLASIVWSTTPQRAAELRAGDDVQLAAALARATEQRLGPLEPRGERASFPLAHLHARRYVAHRAALVGDAAHTVHPLAGQGVNLGFLDAAALVETLLRARARGRDLGLAHNLRRYERARRGHNELMRRGLSAFHRLFGARLAPARRLRNAGLEAVDRVVPLKRAFIGFASGVGRDLPALARAPRPDPPA